MTEAMQAQMAEADGSGSPPQGLFRWALEEQKTPTGKGAGQANVREPISSTCIATPFNLDGQSCQGGASLLSRSVRLTKLPALSLVDSVYEVCLR